MARPIKKGIDYFPLDVNFLNDIKIRKIMRACGANAVAILVSLLSNIYKDEGYFIVWDDDLAFLIGDEIVGVNEGLVSEVVKKALQVEFFNQGMFNEFHILTSHGIQKRYRKAAYQKKESSIEFQYSLLHDKPSKSYEKHNGNEVNHMENQVNHVISTQSKEKESKGNKNKEDETAIKPKNAFAAWQSLWQFPNEWIRQDIVSWIEEFGDEMVCAAIKIAAQKTVERNKAHAFIESVLSEWRNSHVTTIEQARAYEQTRKATAKAKNSYGTKSVVKKETKPDWAEQELTQFEEKPMAKAKQKEIDERIAKLHVNKPGVRKEVETK